MEIKASSNIRSRIDVCICVFFLPNHGNQFHDLKQCSDMLKSRLWFGFDATIAELKSIFVCSTWALDYLGDLFGLSY